MMQRLSDAGVPIVVRLTMGARLSGDVVDANVVGEIRGRERPDEIVVIGGHLDSWEPSCGAHDDASGAVLAMEAARVLKETGLRPRRTIRVVLFTNEERGLEGGRGYLDAHRSVLDKHAAALEADAGAFAPSGFSFQGAPAAADRLAALMPLFRPLGELTLDRGGAGTDISPIVEQGVPGLGLRTRNGRYFDFHHSAADTPDKIEPGALNDALAACALMTWLLAEIPEPLPRQAAAGGEKH
jgi:carboxypeptidase Q